MNERGDLDLGALIGAFIILSVVLLVALMVTIVFYDVGLDSGSGEQIGYISEVETGGWIWKTTEIKLISVEPTFDEGDTSWHFATTDVETTNKARQFMRTHEKVIVKYETWQAAPRWYYANRYPAVDIIPA